MTSLSTADAAHHDEDARILRRTRLRLMAVSGVVTLVILVALGVAAYAVVSRAIGDSEQTALNNYLARAMTHPLTLTGPEPAELGGEAANLFTIAVGPDGTPLGPRNGSLPTGLPDRSSLAGAAASSQGLDKRSVTTSDGSNYTVISVQAVLQPSNQSGWFIQVVQNRTADVRLLNTLIWALLATGGAALLASVLAGFFYAGRALVPIRASMIRREAALQRQREFAANASHELRTPLTVIGASVEDLKRNRRSRVEDVGEALGDIDAEVSHMTALVEDLLLLARTDSGVVQVERLPVDLGDIAVEAASMLSGLGEEKAVRIELEPLPAMVLGDQLRLRQLVTILTDNAIRHTNQGSTVRVQIRPDTTMAIMRVDDQGPGVKPEDLPRIFERFWRADDAPAGGTGLGLSIAKWIVEQHGGSIGAYNRAEGGASFWVQLPLYAPMAAQPEELGTADATIVDVPTWAPDEEVVAMEPGVGAEGRATQTVPKGPYPA